MESNQIKIPHLLRQLANMLEKPENTEMTEGLSLLVRNLLVPQVSPAKTDEVEFTIVKGKNYLVVMMIWVMVEIGWITLTDPQTKKKMNVEEASQWFYKLLFGRSIKKWDQVLEYIFRWRSKEDVEKFLKVFDTMKELVRRRIKKD